MLWGYMVAVTWGCAEIVEFLLGIVEFWRELATKYWNRRQREWAEDLITRTFRAKELMRGLTLQTLV